MANDEEDSSRAQNKRASSSSFDIHSIRQPPLIIKKYTHERH
jgi:hypothetical protein